MWFLKGVFLVTLSSMMGVAVSWAVNDPAPKSKTKVAAALPTDGKLPILLWDTLLLKDSKKKEDQEIVNSLGTLPYRIPGFMVPLETEKNTTNEFLFMPSLPACAHVPPPPPSQTVHVKMNKGLRVKIAWDPIWVEGTVSVKAGKQTGYEASYEIQSSGIKTLKPEDLNEIQKLLPPSTYVPDCNGRDKFEPACQGGSKKIQPQI